jgi:hypothetical protein
MNVRRVVTGHTAERRATVASDTVVEPITTEHVISGCVCLCRGFLRRARDEAYLDALQIRLDRDRPVRLR